MKSIRLRTLLLCVCALAASLWSGSCFAQTPAVAVAADARLGLEKYEARQFVEATKLLKKAVKKNPADHVSWYYLGLSLLPQNKTKDSAKAFETSIKLRPNFASAHAGLAYALMNRNKLLEAEREARASLAIDDKMVDAYYVLGVVQLRTGWREKALETGETAIKLNPNFAPAYLLKSRALVSFFDDAVIAPPQESAEVRRERYTQAGDALEKYLNLYPNSEEKDLWTAQLEALRFHARAGGPGTTRAAFTGKEVTTKARVLAKPEPAYTELARSQGVTGTVVLRCIFGGDAVVKHFVIIRALPYGLTEASIRAAKKIKFVPATMDGRPVSMFIQLEYNFNLY